MSALRFWLVAMDAAAAVYLWTVRKASDATDWGGAPDPWSGQGDW